LHVARLPAALPSILHKADRSRASRQAPCAGGRSAGPTPPRLACPSQYRVCVPLCAQLPAALTHLLPQRRHLLVQAGHAAPHVLHVPRRVKEVVCSGRQAQTNVA
jgi:hypothetical protein